MQMKRYYFIGIAIILMAALALVGYGAWLNYSDENQIAHRMEERRLQLTGARAESYEIQPTMNLDTVRIYCEKVTDAVAMTDGRIQHWAVKKQAAVHQGDLLLTMRNEQIPLRIQEAASSMRRAEAALAQAVNSYHRQQRLLERRATSREKYEEAEAQYQAALESVEEAKARHDQYLVQQDWLNIYSPVDGDVLIIYHGDGAFVQAGSPVAMIGDFSELLFDVIMNDKEAVNFSPGDSAVLRLQEAPANQKVYGTGYSEGNQGENMEIHAELKEISPSPEEPSDIRQLVWKINNRPHFLEPMTYNGVTLQFMVPRRCLTIPRIALLDSQYSSVFVADADGVLHQRQVETGVSDLERIEILSGLSEGDVVIVGNLDGLQDGMRVDVVMQEANRNGNPGK